MVTMVTSMLKLFGFHEEGIVFHLLANQTKIISNTLLNITKVSKTHDNKPKKFRCFLLILYA